MVIHGLFHKALEVLRVGGKGPGRKTAVESHGEGHGIKLFRNHAGGDIFGLGSLAGCGRGLPLG